MVVFFPVRDKHVYTHASVYIHYICLYIWIVYKKNHLVFICWILMMSSFAYPVVRAIPFYADDSCPCVTTVHRDCCYCSDWGSCTVTLPVTRFYQVPRRSSIRGEVIQCMGKVSLLYKVRVNHRIVLFSGCFLVCRKLSFLETFHFEPPSCAASFYSIQNCSPMQADCKNVDVKNT